MCLLFICDPFTASGSRYAIPVYCLSYPVNIVVDDSDRDSPAEFSEPISNNTHSASTAHHSSSNVSVPNPGHDLKIKVRVSLTGSDIRLVVNTGELALGFSFLLDGWPRMVFFTFCNGSYRDFYLFVILLQQWMKNGT